MSDWGVIKQTINKDMGTPDFFTIDELISLTQEVTASTENVIKSWDYETSPPKNINFIVGCNGNIRLRASSNLQEGRNANANVYLNETLIRSGTLEYGFTLDVEIKKGDLISINFENENALTSGGYIRILGQFVNHYGLREV